MRPYGMVKRSVPISCGKHKEKIGRGIAPCAICYPRTINRSAARAANKVWRVR